MTDTLRELVKTWRELAAFGSDEAKADPRTAVYNQTVRDCADALAAALDAQPTPSGTTPPHWKQPIVRSFAEALGFDPDTGESAAESADIDPMMLFRVRTLAAEYGWNYIGSVADWLRDELCLLQNLKRLPLPPAPRDQETKVK